MFDFFLDVLRYGVLGYIFSILIAVKHSIVDDNPDTPKMFWINVAMFTAIALISSFFIK